MEERPSFYVGRYDRKIDDKGRLTLPSEFSLQVGDVIYFKKSELEVKCYDNRTFQKHAETLSELEFTNYGSTHVQNDHRLNLNGHFEHGIEVIVEGRGLYFIVKDKKQVSDKKEN